jgi:hypothetical protein
MKQVQKNIALGLINLILINSTLGIASVYAATDNSALLLNDVKTLRATIDSGAAAPATAVDTFSAAITAQNLSLDDVNAFVKTQMTDEQFSAYQTSITTSLNGIDPSTLKPEEVGQIVGAAVSDVQTTGLYWNGCADVWTGAAIIAAAVVAGIFAIVKSKSVASIQSDYEAKIAQQKTDTANQVTQTQQQYSDNITNTTNSYNKQISDTNNWQTAFPTDIQNENSTISSASNEIQGANQTIANLEREISSEQYTVTEDQEAYDSDTAGTTQWLDDSSVLSGAESTLSGYQNQVSSENQTISNDNSDISAAQQAIANYEKLTATYTADPAQAAIDAANLTASRDSAVADLQAAEPVAIATIQTSGATAVTDLQNTENQDVANVPANQALAEKLAIGGGIGAAIGAGLLVYGIHTDACSN